jgi:hypothetical protein
MDLNNVFSDSEESENEYDIQVDEEFKKEIHILDTINSVVLFKEDFDRYLYNRMQYGMGKYLKISDIFDFLENFLEKNS